jgi:hypothetical protein
MYRIMIRFTLALLTLLTLAACGVPAQPIAETIATPVANPAKPKIGAYDTLLTIRAEGGLCMDGGCWSENQIKADGSFTVADNTGAQTTGALGAAAVAELTQQMAATDFEQLKAQPFTGTCPLASDGQEYTYTFQTLSGPQTLASCSVEIDQNNPLFQTVDGLLKIMTGA